MKFLIWTKKHGGAFWRTNSAGYTINPDIAGRYSSDEAKEICEPSRGECVACTEDSDFVKKERKAYLQKKRRSIRSCLESMTPKQVLEILPELVQERIELQMRNGI